MNTHHRIFLIAAVVVGSFGISVSAHAASLSLVPNNAEIGIGETMTIEVRIDSQGVSFNAAQAVIRFPKALLEVTGLDPSDSAFTFWLEDPRVSDAEGFISFTGGTPYGVSGDAISVLKVHFRAKTVGSGALSIMEAAVSAADGSGTNILTKMNDAVVTVIPKRSTPTVPEFQQKIPEPEPLAREPVPAKKLPTIPALQVPLYPDPTAWHNVVAQFAVSWNVPSDVSGVSTVLDKQSNSTAPERSEGLFETKLFPSLSDGVWYVHVRFRNSIGWGPTAHYRIAIDTRPPMPFKITVPTGLSNDNPAPEFFFATSDALSGIRRSEIIIDTEAPILASGSSYRMFPHPPGTYPITIRVFDAAGNGIEDKVTIEILPIASPTISFLTRRVIIGSDDVLVVRGASLPNTNVIVMIENADRFLVVQDEVPTNGAGEWEFRLDRELRRGTYGVIVQAKDARGALSVPTERMSVTVAERPVIVLFGLNITLRWLLAIVLGVALGAAAWFYRKTILRLARSQRESIIIRRDLGNACEAIKKYLLTIGTIIKKDAQPETRDIEFQAVKKKIVDALDTIAKYIGGDIERL